MRTTSGGEVDQNQPILLFLDVLLFTKPFEFPFSREICSDDIGGNIVMCPLCDRKCGYWKLNTTCNSSWVRHSLITDLKFCALNYLALDVICCHDFYLNLPPTAIAPFWQCGNCVFCHFHGDLGWVKCWVKFLLCFCISNPARPLAAANEPLTSTISNIIINRFKKKMF